MKHAIYIVPLVFAACTAATDPPIGDDDQPPTCGDGVVDSGEDCDDGNAVSGDGCSAACRVETGETHVTTATWHVIDLASRTETGCPLGFDTMVVNSQELDANGDPVGATIQDQFDCTSQTGTTSPLAPGRYETYLEITNGTQTYARSLSQVLDLASDQTMDVEIFNDGGYFSFTWDLVGADTGTPLACADVAADGIEAISTDVSDASNAASDIFTCTDGLGVTAGLLAGTYTVSIDALDANMQAIGVADALTDQQILDANQVTSLGAITIPIAGQ